MKPQKHNKTITRSDRLPEESGVAWEAAKTYFEMGAERTHALVAKKLCKSSTIISRWASRFGWKERARAWDQEQYARQKLAELKAVESKAKEWAERTISSKEMLWQAAQDAKRLAGEHFALPLVRKVINSPDGKQITIEPVNGSHHVGVKLMEMWAKFSLLSTDQNTDSVAITGPKGEALKTTLADISDEQLDKLLDGHDKRTADKSE